LRVLLLSWEYPPLVEGGLGRHVHKLSEQLAAGQAVALHVLTRGEHATPADEQRGGVWVHRVRRPPFTSDLSVFLEWVAGMNREMATRGEQLCAQTRFELVHSHDWLVAQAAQRIALGTGVPWLVTVHATEHGRHQGWVAEHPQSDIHAAECAMAQQADQLITCSEYMRGHVAQVLEVAPARISVIPNGIDPREMERVEPDLRAVRARYAQPHQRLVLMVGRLMFEKGFHLALDALAAIVAQQPDVRFVLAGSGLAREQLQLQAQRLGLSAHGSFLGPISEELLHALYLVADVCVVPSLYEPFGIVALEAMVCGCLCVVADTGGLCEIVPGDSSVGLRFKAGDVEALRRVLTRALTDDALRERLVAAARQYVTRFDWSSIANRTVAVYQTLVHD
jgi:glycogen(starch) synthase